MSVIVLRLLAVAAVVTALAAGTSAPPAAAASPVLVETPAPVASPGAVARPAGGAGAVPAASGQAPCAAPNLTLREVRVTGGPPLPEAVYALRNRGAACRISGAVGIRLFDAQGKPLPLRIGPRSAMPMLLTLAPDDEASFSVSYGRPGTTQCETSARIEVYLAPQTTPVSAPTSLSACAFPAARVSSLTLAVPSPLPSASP